MKDLIERQAAIDVILADKIDNKSLKVMDALGNGNEAKTLNMTCDRHAELLKSLPSAQPEQGDFEKQLHDMFDHIWNCEIDHPVFQDTVGDLMRAVIEAHYRAPQPDIIRCRDCISYQEGIDIDGKPFTRCNGSVRTYGHTPPDWYCADAKRRTDERQT